MFAFVSGVDVLEVLPDLPVSDLAQKQGRMRTRSAAAQE
jgi:hypothetical protein